MARTPQIPKYRKHASGQARVTLNRKDYLLGAYGSAASHEAYQRIIAEWLSGTRRAPAPNKKEPTSVNAIILAYWQFAVGHYGSRPDERRGDYYCLRDALKVVESLYGRTNATDFGPLALKDCRARMIQMDWSRKYVNAQIDRVRRLFRWAASEEMLDGSIGCPFRFWQCLRRRSRMRSSPPSNSWRSVPPTRRRGPPASARPFASIAD